MSSEQNGGGGGGQHRSSSKSRRRSQNPAIPTPEEERIIRREGGKILDKMTPSHSAFFARVRSRTFPSFERKEMGLGRTLGMGTFCRVAEILEIRLKLQPGEEEAHMSDEDTEDRRNVAERANDQGYAHGAPMSFGDNDGGGGEEDFEPSLDMAMMAADIPTGHSRAAMSVKSAGSLPSNHDHPAGENNGNNGPSGGNGRGSNGVTFDQPRAMSPAFDDADDVDENYLANSERNDLLDQAGHDQHYNMSPSETRKFMERKCVRRTNDGRPPAARYAVKRLRPDLNENERINGAIDLAVEARFLSSVYHPNIVKMRGLVGGPDPLSPGFFLVLDRLYDTLEQRMEGWREVRRTYAGCCGGMFGGDKEELRILMADRLKVAYDVAAVFRYLHSHKLIYRDIKTDNIGFDVRGDVKVFDFGLCKELVPEEQTRDGKAYKLTGLTGSFRYMAPEVALSRPYNLSADVYSYGVLLWQILDLKHPFGNLNMSDYTAKVVKSGYRPTKPSKGSTGYPWPDKTRKMAERSMADRPSDRPAFEKIAAQVKNDLLVTSYDSNGSIANRSAHMLTRSQCSGDTGSAASSKGDGKKGKGGRERSNSNSEASTGSIGSAKRTK